MPPRNKRRDQWRLTKTGTWTRSLGSRGQRVRLFQITKDGYFFREVRHRDGTKDRRTLRTRDRSEAEQLGQRLLAALMTGSAPEPRAGVRLGDLAEAFVSESPMFLDNAKHTKADQRTRIRILRAVIRDARDVRTLSENDVRQYEARRRAGGIEYGGANPTDPVRQRSVQADVKLLKQMLRWACTRTMPNGQRWLDQNPLEYVRVQGERDVRRPVADFDRYEATLAAMRDLQAKYAEEARTLGSRKAAARAEARRLAWVKAEFALWLIEGTGRRRGAIVGLRWVDIDFEGRRITWRAEFDKAKRTSVIPYAADFFETIREFQCRLGSIGGFIFAKLDDAEQPTQPELVYQWIMKAERHAGLPKLQQGGTHTYRRKYVSERRHHPLKSMMAAGGWSDPGTILRCYDQPDEADVLAVTSETRKRLAAPQPRPEPASA